MNLKKIWDLIKTTFTEFSEDKAPRLAAALSYYTLFSLAPLLVIVIAIAGLVFDRQSVQTQIINQITSLIGPQAKTALETMIASSPDRQTSVVASIIGVVALLLGATGVFGQLQDALNTMWEVAPKPNRGLLGMIKDRFFSFTMVLGVGFLLLVSLVITAALSAINEYTTGLFPGFETVMQIINFVVSFGVITVLFALIFKYVPDAEIAWRDVWLGAAITALLFTIGRSLIGIYLGNSDILSGYGAAGSLVIILLWVYYSAQILFLGAEFTQVYANKFGSRVVPDEDAVPLTEEARAQQGMPRQEALGAASSGTTPAEKAPVAGEMKPSTAPVREPELLPEAQPSVLAFSAILAILVGFVSGLVVKKGTGPKKIIGERRNGDGDGRWVI